MRDYIVCSLPVKESMEIPFKKIELQDKTLIEYYLAQKTYRSCELIFANVYLWSKKFPVEFAIVEDTLIFRSFVERDGVSITFPAGKMEQIHKAMDTMITWFENEKQEMQMYLVQEQEFELLRLWYPGQFEIEYDRDAADYVYETEKLTTLAGKKLHGKRNHINKFKEIYPNWSYETLTTENVEDCFQMALKWREENQCEKDIEKRDEMCVTLNALRLLKELELQGGIIRVDGEVMAFCIGEALNPDTFVVHIEKAFAEIQGVYPMINQQFVAHEAQDYLYVNREDDAGLEGLRKAKLSYRPAFLVEKGMVKKIGGNSND
ncbi:MAG: phosphatidylglycerol lysyltransferase domain-containing protein [Lachnospiraceae bacterium]